MIKNGATEVTTDACIIQIRTDGIVAERQDTPSNETIWVSYQELFYTEGRVRQYPALAICGREVVRVGDDIRVTAIGDGKWSRRCVLREVAERLKPGTIVDGHVTGFTSSWLLLSIQDGIPARVELSSLIAYFQECGEKIDVSSRQPLGGILRIGDPISGFVAGTDSDGLVEVDVVSRLCAVRDGRIEKHRPHLPDLKRRAPQHVPPAYKAPPSLKTVPCPRGLREAIVIEDERTWVDETLRPWLEAAGTKVRLLEENDWSRVREIATAVRPDIILVDVILDTKRGVRADGRDIARELVSNDYPWHVVIITGGELARDKGSIPNVWGPVPKTNDMAHLADVIQDIISDEEPPPPGQIQPSRQTVRRRTMKETAGQVEAIVNNYASYNGILDVAVFAYDLVHDMARLKHGTLGVLTHFDDYGEHMHKSQIRDLVYSEDPLVRYPSQAGYHRSWRWMHRLMDARGILGVRLNTPHRDEVWSLFAFYDNDRDMHEAEFHTVATSIEDAYWHYHYENIADEDKCLRETGERIINLTHEVNRGARNILRDEEHAIGFLEQVPPDIPRALSHLASASQFGQKLLGLAARLLHRRVATPGKVRIEDLLSRCVYPYARPRSPWSLAKEARVYYAVDPPDLTVNGDGILIEIILDNLLENAIRAIREMKGVRTSSESGTFGEICVEAYDDGSSVVIALHDTGCGIHHFDQQHMWERGYSTRPEGTGLGMPICDSAVRQIGASLDVAYTALFVGTTFELRFPRYLSTNK